MYQCVRNAILSYLMITYNLQIGRFGIFFMTQSINGLFCAMHVRPSILFTMFSKHYLVDIGSQCERVPGKRIIVYRKYVMFIKQSPTRFKIVTN